MGMSGSTYNARANQITKEYYNQLLSTDRNAVYSVRRVDNRGTYTHTTYHINKL